jgi:hypothetical protein
VVRQERQLDGIGGVYCEDCNVANAGSGDSEGAYGVRPRAIDPEAADRLWDLSERLIGREFRL